MKIMIIGGSRFVGPVLVNQLIVRGHETTVFNRGLVNKDYPKEVKFIRGDREKGFAVNQHFDVVVDMCAYNGKQTQTALDQLDYDLFIHFGSVASYKKAEVFPLTEESETGYWPFMGDYSRGKVECEQVLASSGQKYATIRPNYILGPENYIDRENFIYSRIKSGTALILPGNGQALSQYVFAKDVAAIIVMIAEQQLTGAYNCAGDEQITTKGLVEYMATLVGKEAVIKYNPSTDGENHNEDEFPFANENMIASNQKVKDLGFEFTPLFDGLKQDFESYYSKLLA